jgi:hypothetical protein
MPADSNLEFKTNTSTENGGILVVSDADLTNKGEFIYFMIDFGAALYADDAMYAACPLESLATLPFRALITFWLLMRVDNSVGSPGRSGRPMLFIVL